MSGAHAAEYGIASHPDVWTKNASPPLTLLPCYLVLLDCLTGGNPTSSPSRLRREEDQRVHGTIVCLLHLPPAVKSCLRLYIREKGSAAYGEVDVCCVCLPESSRSTSPARGPPPPASASASALPPAVELRRRTTAARPLLPPHLRARRLPSLRLRLRLREPAVVTEEPVPARTRLTWRR